jgi:hypothetical protein
MKQQSTKQPDAHDELITVSPLPPMVDAYENEPLFEFFKSGIDNFQNPLKAIWENPVGRIFCILGGAYVALNAGGHLLRAAANFVGGMNDLIGAIKKPTGSPPSTPKSS